MRPIIPRSWRERNRHALRQFWARTPADALGVKQELERRCRRTASRQNNRPRERQGDNMTGTAQRETPRVAIFWLVQATEGEARLLAAGCPLDQAEPYGNCLTYGPGHYYAGRARQTKKEEITREAGRSKRRATWVFKARHGIIMSSQLRQSP
jgi:hypothetical protein